jgi:Protein of unknown function (DUF3224)
MNCHVCGTQLPEEATYCLRCGVATRYYSWTTEGAPDDPTVVSSPDAIAPQNGEGSLPSHNPYETSNVAPIAPPPPSFQRRGKPTRIIVGAIVLVLLLIGGGGLAWFEYATASHALTVAAVATATAQAHAPASVGAASQPFAANGTFTTVSSTTTQVQQDGSNKISRMTQQGVIYGGIAGSLTNEETLTLYPDNTGAFSGSMTCTCTVAGKSGILMWSYIGTQTADGSFQGQVFDIHGSGDLAQLHGQGEFRGQGSHGTYSSQLHFDP